MCGWWLFCFLRHGVGCNAGCSWPALVVSQLAASCLGQDKGPILEILWWWVSFPTYNQRIIFFACTDHITSIKIQFAIRESVLYLLILSCLLFPRKGINSRAQQSCAWFNVFIKLLLKRLPHPWPPPASVVAQYSPVLTSVTSGSAAPRLGPWVPAGLASSGVAARSPSALSPYSEALSWGDPVLSWLSRLKTRPQELLLAWEEHGSLHSGGACWKTQPCFGQSKGAGTHPAVL